MSTTLSIFNTSIAEAVQSAVIEAVNVVGSVFFPNNSGSTAFTPSVLYAGAAGGSATVNAYYTVISNTVKFNIFINFQTIPTGTATDAVTISGLPIASINHAVFTPISLITSNISLTNAGGTAYGIQGLISPNSTTISLLIQNIGAPSAALARQNLANSCTMGISGTYLTS